MEYPELEGTPRDHWVQLQDAAVSRSSAFSKGARRAVLSLNGLLCADGGHYFCCICVFLTQILSTLLLRLRQCTYPRMFPVSEPLCGWALCCESSLKTIRNTGGREKLVLRWRNLISHSQTQMQSVPGRWDELLTSLSSVWLTWMERQFSSPICRLLRSLCTFCCPTVGTSAFSSFALHIQSTSFIIIFFF